MLRAAWPKITIVTVDVAEKLHKTPEMVEKVVAGKSTAVAEMYRTRVLEP